MVVVVYMVINNLPYFSAFLREERLNAEFQSTLLWIIHKLSIRNRDVNLEGFVLPPRETPYFLL